ncbi:MAG: hypothetical protein ACLQVD_08975 [Capsulimonadaceae bacterium]
MITPLIGALLTYAAFIDSYTIGMGTGIAAAIVCAVVALFDARAAARRRAEVEEALTPLWSGAMEIWRRLHYCEACHMVFDPRNGRMAIPEAMLSLLYPRDALQQIVAPPSRRSFTLAALAPVAVALLLMGAAFSVYQDSQSSTDVDESTPGTEGVPAPSSATLSVAALATQYGITTPDRSEPAFSQPVYGVGAYGLQASQTADVPAMLVALAVSHNPLERDLDTTGPGGVIDSGVTRNPLDTTNLFQQNTPYGWGTLVDTAAGQTQGSSGSGITSDPTYDSQYATEVGFGSDLDNSQPVSTPSVATTQSPTDESGGTPSTLVTVPPLGTTLETVPPVGASPATMPPAATATLQAESPVASPNPTGGASMSGFTPVQLGAESEVPSSPNGAPVEGYSPGQMDPETEVRHPTISGMAPMQPEH